MTGMTGGALAVASNTAQVQSPTMTSDNQPTTCKQEAAVVSQQPAQDSMLPPNERAAGLPSAALDDGSSSSHNFRMYSFKVVRCSKRYVHDWRTCPYAHPTENARRRDPREFRYYAIPCPEYKKGICLLGDACPYSHGVYECWLHPSKYCTQLCKDGEQCRRPVCFFAHSPQDLRQADTQYDPLPEDLERAEAFRMQQQASAKMQQTINRSAASNLAACHPTLQAVLEASLADPEATLLRLAAAQTQQAQQQQQAPLLLSGSPPRAGRFSLDALYASGGRGGGVVGNGMLPPNGNGMHGNGMLPNAANGMHGMVQPAAPVSNGQGCSSPTSSHSSGDSLQQALAGAVSNGNAGVPSRRSVDSTGSNGPRMSNAMARKLGLAPTRECKRPGVAAAAAAAAAVAAVSSRASLDGSSHVDSLRSFGSVPANGFQNGPPLLPSASSMLPPLHPGHLDLQKAPLPPRFSLDSSMAHPVNAMQDAQQLQQLQALLTQLQGMQLQGMPANGVEGIDMAAMMPAMQQRPQELPWNAHALAAQANSEQFAAAFAAAAAAQQGVNGHAPNGMMQGQAESEYHLPTDLNAILSGGN